jgi:hypothetical protein
LERYKVPNRAGSGFFIILMTFLYLNFLKLGIDSIEDLELQILEWLPFGGFSAHFNFTGVNQRK